MNDKNQEGYIDLTASHAGFEVTEITLTHGKFGRTYRL